MFYSIFTSNLVRKGAVEIKVAFITFTEVKSVATSLGDRTVAISRPAWSVDR